MFGPAEVKMLVMASRPVAVLLVRISLIVRTYDIANLTTYEMHGKVLWLLLLWKRSKQYHWELVLPVE